MKSSGAESAPTLKYPGAKWRIAEWILGYMPAHESYLEPFFGSGAVLFNKQPSRIETINDLDGGVVHFFKTCREQPEELARALALTPYARSEYNAADFHDDGMVGDVERARQFAVRSWMAMGSCMSGKTGWRHTTGKVLDGGPDNPKLWSRMPQQVIRIAERLRAVQIENRPALDVIRRFNGPNVLMYIDPPYVLDTRTAHRNQYRYEMSNMDHHKLLRALKRTKAMVMLSGYDSALYRSELSGWHVFTKAVVAERGSQRTEYLWLNAAAWESARDADQIPGQVSLFDLDTT